MYKGTRDRDSSLKIDQLDDTIDGKWNEAVFVLE